MIINNSKMTHITKGTPIIITILVMDDMISTINNNIRRAKLC